jgi:hypothetical protein
MLTPAQLALLKADILADSTLNAFPNNPDGNTAIAAAYAIAASPNYWVWRTFVADQEIYERSFGAGADQNWSWTTYIGRSQGERDAWRQMVNMAGGLNPSLSNTRAGVADIFSGAGGANQRTYLLTVSRRLATRVEKLLATGAGTTANPSVMGFEGMLSADDVQAARNS